MFALWIYSWGWSQLSWFAFAPCGICWLLPGLENPKWGQPQAWSLGAGFPLRCLMLLPTASHVVCSASGPLSTWPLASCSRAWTFLLASFGLQESKNGSCQVCFELGPKLAQHSVGGAITGVSRTQGEGKSSLPLGGRNCRLVQR